jgi:hypothetical protein
VWLETTVFLTNNFADACELGQRWAATFLRKREQSGDVTWHRIVSIKALRTQHQITPLE